MHVFHQKEVPPTIPEETILMTLRRTQWEIYILFSCQENSFSDFDRWGTISFLFINDIAKDKSYKKVQR